MENNDSTGWLPCFEGDSIPNTPESELQYYKDFVEYQKDEIAALKREREELEDENALLTASLADLHTKCEWFEENYKQ